jgi:putative glycosyltransferase (TIGR04372 family)
VPLSIGTLYLSDKEKEFNRMNNALSNSHQLNALHLHFTLYALYRFTLLSGLETNQSTRSIFDEYTYFLHNFKIRDGIESTVPSAIRPLFIDKLSRQGFSVPYTKTDDLVLPYQKKMLSELASVLGSKHVFGVDRFISLGHIHSLFMYYTYHQLIAGRITSQSAVLLIPDDESISCCPDIEDINNQLELNFDVVRYNPLKPHECCDSVYMSFLELNGSEGVRQDILYKLHDRYLFQSDVAFDPSLCSDKYNMLVRNQLFLRQASVLRLRRSLANWTGNRELNSWINNVQRPIVLITNRDSAYKPGQDYRNMHISYFEPIIQHLIRQGFAVARINSVGNPCSFSNQYLFDCTQCDEIKFIDQLKLISVAKYNIGTATGIIEFASQLFGIKTLWLNNPHIFAQGFIDSLYFAPKKLLVTNRQKWDRLSKKDKMDLIFSSDWGDNDSLMNYGIKHDSLSYIESLFVISDFLKSKNYKRITSSCSITSYPPFFVAESSMLNISDLLSSSPINTF